MQGGQQGRYGFGAGLTKTTMYTHVVCQEDNINTNSLNTYHSRTMLQAARHTEEAIHRSGRSLTLAAGGHQCHQQHPCRQHRAPAVPACVRAQAAHLSASSERPVPCSSWFSTMCTNPSCSLLRVCMRRGGGRRGRTVVWWGEWRQPAGGRESPDGGLGSESSGRIANTQGRVCVRHTLWSAQRAACVSTACAVLTACAV